MNLQEIKEIAKNRHIKTYKLTKSEIIRSIQRVEGNFDCFASAVTKECDQTGCLWRKDCFAAAANESLH